jgi:SAM-dependent MidA family methyltransferase
VSDTPLARKIRRLIEADGPLTVAQYMAICLGDPEHGYYVTRDPIGAAGDFITAPEVNQMFGEIVGSWLVHAWRLAGSPSPVRLVELGPGRGTLMADIFRVAKSVPEFFEAISVYLVEQSPVLRAQQAAKLSAARVQATWCADFEEVPKGALLLVANEFFDALPIRQFMRMDDVWRERVVGLDAAGELAFGIGAGMIETLRREPEAALSIQGDATESLEIRPAADAIAGKIAGRIAAHGGAALIIDYGYERRCAGGDTLQAVHGHTYADPLSAPGETDLTAHVDFAALTASVREAGATPHGPMGQGDFLLSLGLRERAAKLAENADDATRKTLEAAVARLTGAEQMGELFKALAITPHGMDVPPFPAAI